MANQNSANVGRFYWIDWLRFGAAFVVLLCHARAMHFVEFGALQAADRNWATALAYALSRLGLEAVVLFFVLSGYLVGGRSLQRWRDGVFKAGPYFLDRATRIYVPLVPTLVLTTVGMLMCGLTPSAAEFVVNLLGLQGVVGTIGVFGGNAPLWSLAYEIWFYLMWGCALIICSNAATLAKLFSAGLVLAAFFVFTRLDVTYLFCWLLGVVAHQVGPIRAQGKCVAVALPLIMAGVVLMQLNSGSLSVDLSSWRSAIPSKAWSTLILAAGFGLLIHCIGAWEPATSLGWSLAVH